MIPKEELRWYLFEENIDIQKKKGFINFEESILGHMDKFMYYYPLLQLFGIKSKIFYNLRKNSAKDRILVHDYLWKYQSIVKQLQLNYNPIFFGLNIKPFILSCHENIHYPLYGVYKKIYAGITNSENILLEDGFLSLKKDLEKIDPKLIILDFDFYPETRMMTLAAKELGIPTIEIQHGIFPRDKKIISGNYVDYVMVWGEYFRDLYLKSEIKHKPKIRILGYPFPINNNDNIQYGKKVVYLGQPLEMHGHQFLNEKIDLIWNLDALCRKNGFEFIYKPHRGEDLGYLQKKLPLIKFYPINKKIEDAIDENDIFISFNSTALVEAALNSKISIQLKVFNIPADDFRKLEICRTFRNLSEFDDFLKDLKTSDDPKSMYFPVNSSYIEIPSPGPGEKFIELIKDNILG